MSFAVSLTDDASRDIEEIYDYISSRDAPEKAEHVLDRFERALESLSEAPERGAHPKELSILGIREFREIFFKPYRIVYRVTGKNVHVLLVADGRRDMQALLQRRLLE